MYLSFSGSAILHRKVARPGINTQILKNLYSAREHLSKIPAILKRFRQTVLAAALSGRLTEEWREKHTPSESSAELLLPRVFAERKREYDSECAKAQGNGQRPPRPPDNLEQEGFLLPEALVLPEIPEAWSWASVHDVISLAQYGTSVKADGSPNGGVPLLRMGNIQDGHIDLTDLQYIRRESENIPDFRLAKGDVLFNRTNSPELVGKTAIYDSDLEAVFASYLIRVRTDPRMAAGEYLSAWLNSPWGRWWARAVRTDGVSQSNINASKLKAMPIPLPPVQEQVEIIRRMNLLFTLSATIDNGVQAARKRVEKLSQSILAKAFRGDLVPTEAELARRESREYEPASMLLERIRAEKTMRVRMLRPFRSANRGKPLRKLGLE